MTQPAANEVRILPVRTLPEIQQGDDLAVLILEAIQRERLALQTKDVVVVTQKAISKAEGRVLDLRTVTPSPFAEFIAQQSEKDPRVVEVVLRESRRIVRMDRGLLIMETHHGFVCANAGVDHSNLPDDNNVSLLPVDPDASAQRLQQAFRERAQIDVAVLITDSFGRAWREGITEVAIGLAGMAAVRDYRGRHDAYGHLLRTTEVALADELASAAGLVMEKSSGVPVVIIRGFPYDPGDGGAKTMVRAPEKDLFR